MRRSAAPAAAQAPISLASMGYVMLAFVVVRALQVAWTPALDSNREPPPPHDGADVVRWAMPPSSGLADPALPLPPSADGELAIHRYPISLRDSELGIVPTIPVATASPSPVATTSPTLYAPINYETAFPNVSELNTELWKPIIEMFQPDLNLETCVEHCLLRNDKSRHKFLVPDDPECSASRAPGAGEWCSQLYSPEAIRHACNLICRNQYPADCSTRKFYLMHHDHGAGIGSSLHQRLVSITNAINMDRTFAYNPQHKSLWTHDDDEQAECAKRRHGCYWLPLSNCVVPDDWEKHGDQYIAANPSGYGEDLVPMANIHRRPVNWWKAQLSQFMFRPNPEMLRLAILPIVHRAFASHPQASSQLMPDRFISLFMRQGDKITESALFTVEEYLAKVLEQSKAHNIDDVFVGSDSQRAILEMIKLTSTDPRYVIHHQAVKGKWVPYIRRWFGNLEKDTIDNVWNKAPVREMINIAVAEWVIPQFSMVRIGALSSNYCRFQAENANGFGKYGARYISLDGYSFIG